MSCAGIILIRALHLERLHGAGVCRRAGALCQKPGTPEARDRELLAEGGMNRGGQTSDTFIGRASVCLGSTP